ncbi:PQQ-binding-like beta-propeller repeat protein [Planctomicrobium sp.]|nr:PQQ-binding-like beta-propeller repeat protein [Planctomicrobium sp.]MDA7527862.1 PQQ-binding-like beta-propeller repeat protein [bacterium]MDB4743767.1 PQQ-binding-like beta-propeller repeat protein [Planctomicrobium sp.]
MSIQSRSVPVALLTITLQMVVSSLAIADWPTWQHDNRRTGASEESVAPEKLVLDWAWQSAAPPQSAWPGPAKWDAYAYHRNLPSMRNYDPVFHVIAVDENVFFGSSVDDSLYCLNAKTGKERWSVTVDGPIRLAPTWSNGKVYFGSDDGFARCVNAQDGKLIWKFSPTDSDHLILNNGRFIPFQPCRTGVVVEGDTAWFANALLPWKESWLCAVDANTGTTTKSQHYVKSLPQRTMEGAPALSEKFLVLPQGRVPPRVFDRKTGKDLGEMVKSGGGSVVVVTIEDDVLHGPATDSRKGGFRQSSGKSREVVAGLGRGNALVAAGDTSWMLTDTEIIATSLTKRKVLWKSACDCPYTMIKAGETLFVGGDQIVAAHSAIDGKLLWKKPTTGRVFGLAVANGRLFASSDTGTIHCFAANGSGKPAPQIALNSNTKPPATNLNPIEDKRLIGHWAFQKSSTSQQTIKALQGNNLSLSIAPNFSRSGDYEVLELDGAKQSIMVSPEFKKTLHPKKSFTAETWVRVDQVQNWGSMIGIIQDNGSFERGWLLGYKKNRFCVAVSSKNGPQKLTYLTADRDFQTEQWHHVVGTYDGETMRLFVDGRLSAESKEQSGDISYPDHAFFEIGAYHDKDEYFRMRGALHEVRLYDESLSEAEILKHYHSSKERFPTKRSKANLASGPWLKFLDSQTALVRWTTAQPQATHLEYGPGENKILIHKEPLLTDHVATLTGLRRLQMSHYRIGVHEADGTVFTADYECDNFFNYTPLRSERLPDSSLPVSENWTTELLRLSPGKRGMCLILGEFDSQRLLQLCHDSELRFTVADDDLTRVTRLRKTLRDHGVYGTQVSVHHVKQLSQLPFVGNWANFVVTTTRTDAALVKEMERMVRPDGGVAVVVAQSKVELPPHFSSVNTVEGQHWYHYSRPALPGAGDWTHLYGDPDNAAFTGEDLGGASSTEDLDIQWVGRPGPRYQADRSGRKPSPLATGGRLFLQGLHRIIALDSFNGTVIWSLEIPNLERFNVPRDCSNWCATREHLYVVVKQECWKINTATGSVVDRFPVSNRETESKTEWGYVATHNDRLYGSEVATGASWTDFWGGEGWYDARSGPVTFPICSDRLFCNDASTGEMTWEYQGGVVLNSTISIGGQTMYFVESRNSEVIDSKDRRVGNPELWKDLHLVAIDANTGSPKWEKKLPPKGEQVVFFLTHAAKQLTLVSSANSEFQVASFDDQDGSERWSQSTKWPGGKGDHGKAMSRPAVVGDRLFVRPAVFSLSDGTVLPETMPGGKCGTYACTTNALFMRTWTASMWSPENGKKTDWPRLRPDCWLSTIPAGGMLLSPEGGGGCSCGSWMETSIGFMPKVFDQRGDGHKLEN